MKRRLFRHPALLVFCLLLCLSCTGVVFYTVNMLPDQTAYRRWQGDGELTFSQISCFLPDDGKAALNDVYGFRTAMITALRDASIDTPSGKGFVDCWSTEGSVKVYGVRNSGTASVIAVGGEFFIFHPLKLMNGSYLSESDLMRDNVLLDEDLAWLLFGGNDLEGMTVHIGDIPFRIAGVVAREGDYASKKAYTGGMGLYMSYETFSDIRSEDAKTGIICYEVCIPNPVKGFAKTLTDEKFPIGKGEILENTGRFRFWNLLRYAKDLPSRTMRTSPPYPYWENAARYAETVASLLLVLALLSGFVVLFELLQLLLRGGRRAKERLEDDVLPSLSESAQEAIRVQQRKHWEKTHSE